MKSLKEANLKDQIFNTVEEAIEAIKQGQIVIVADDEDRENEGDLVCAAEKITPEIINFMAKEGRGLICLALQEDIADKLELFDMVNRNSSLFETAFTVSIDADKKFGVSTGISASDRAKTIQIAHEALRAARHDGSYGDMWRIIEAAMVCAEHSEITMEQMGMSPDVMREIIHIGAERCKKNNDQRSYDENMRLLGHLNLR